MTEYFLGVDGGQSGTTAVIGNREGKILGWASAGPCNHVASAEARDKFLRVISICLSQAAEMASVRREGQRWRFESACLGMSGGPADKSALLHEVIEAEHLMVTHDGAIALAGATAGEPGIVVIAGTGSIAFGENGTGETARSGGWGYIYGDEGSAFDIVRQSLRAILRHHEGWGPRTALTPALLALTSAADADEMLHLLYTPEWPRSRVASLAKTVSHVAEEGDPMAAAVLQQAGQQLAMLAGTIRSRLWSAAEPVRLSWTGGVFNSAILLDRFRAYATLAERTRCEPPVHGPAAGALLLALRMAGHNVPVDSSARGTC